MGFSTSLKPRNGKSLQMRGNASSLRLKTWSWALTRPIRKVPVLIFPSLASIEVTAKTLYTFSTCLKLQLARLTTIKVRILFQALWANQFSAFNALSVEINLYAFLLEAYIAILDINRLGAVDRNDTKKMQPAEDAVGASG